MIVTVMLFACQGQKKEQYVGEYDLGSSEDLEAVDLGLPSGTKWANMNVGATAPEEYGDYYAWGEIEAKDVYNHVTYQYVTGEDTDGDGEYDENEEYDNIGSDISGTDYDVAHVEWGGDWRMPTLEQIQELLENSTSEWTELNGVNGRKFTGPNGNSIFLPATGFFWGNSLFRTGVDGYYWSSTQDESYIFNGNHLLFDSGDDHLRCSIRPSGMTIRPVIGND